MDLRAALIALIVLVVAGIGYLTYRMQSYEQVPPLSDGATQALPSSPSTTANLPSATVAPVQPAPEVPVDSAGANAWYDLSRWTLRPAPAGWVDGVRIAAGPADPVSANSILELTGWAGLADLGMRMEHVVLAACGKVFASVPVERPRPDVAANAHPNLNRSGWIARVALDHVPPCADRTVSAFAVSAVSHNAWPLQQGARVGAVQPAVADGPRPRAATRLLQPEDLAEVTLTTIAVKANSLNMRSCAKADCKTVEKVTKGSYPGVVVDEADGWLLIQLEDKAGWMAKQYVAVSPR